MLDKLKAIGAGTLVLGYLALSILMLGLFLKFGPGIAFKIQPILIPMVTILLLVVIFILLPLSFIPRTRLASALVLIFISQFFGFSLWIFGFLVRSNFNYDIPIR